ncbi:hypothetical protein KCP71_12295 [Salmonella enterica subsp. enterica]|nr:hypothetical protein KCP71_12295 [Salmonella enterica subsp. enterica]
MKWRKNASRAMLFSNRAITSTPTNQLDGGNHQRQQQSPALKVSICPHGETRRRTFAAPPVVSG